VSPKRFHTALDVSLGKLLEIVNFLQVSLRDETQQLQGVLLGLGLGEIGGAIALALLSGENFGNGEGELRKDQGWDRSATGKLP
jgi:ribosome-associated protein YbcJ (S4-like RNA binding protein)